MSISITIHQFYRLRDEIQKEDRDVLHLLHQKYFQNGTTTESIEILESLITESIFGTSIPLFALEASKHARSPVYQYLYSHAGSLCLAEVSNLTFWQILGKVRIIQCGQSIHYLVKMVIFPVFWTIRWR